jgi:dTDP-4-dehydrorhamnose 3,5-epimerase-like enzyme
MLRVMNVSSDYKFVKDERGELISIDSLPQFNVKRIFYIDCLQGMQRGKHFHKKGNQLVCLVSGEIEVNAVFRNKTDKFVMRPGDFFLQETFCMFQFKSLVEKSTLIVLCDTNFDQKDYFTNFDQDAESQI